MSGAGVTGSQARARFHERRLYLSSHPVIYALASLAARRGPLVSMPGIGHLVCGPALAREVLGSPERFAKTGPGALSDALTQVMGPNALVNMDGENHRRLRARLQGLFTPAAASLLVEQVLSQPLADLVQGLRSGARVDLARAAQVMSGRVACSILGQALPDRDEEQACLALHRAGAEFAAVLTLTTRRLDAVRIAHARQRFDALTRGARSAWERGDEGSVPGRLRALGLDFEECRGVIGLLFMAGTDTVAAALPRIVAMLVDSGQWGVLVRHRQAVPQAVDEGLRLSAAVPLMTRNVVAATELGGRPLGRNQRVIVLLFKVLQSLALLSEPQELRLDRARETSPAPLWFGHGPHFCLGAALARRQIEAALTALLDLGDLAIVSRGYRRHSPLPGYGRLEVERASAA